MTKYSTLLICLLFVSSSWAQVPSEEMASVKAAFPDKEYVYTNYEWTLDLSLKKGKVISTLHRDETGICLSEKEIRFKEGSIRYSSFSDLESFEAETLVPTEKKYKSVKVDDITEYDMASGSVFYDDQKTMKYRWPQLMVGAKKHRDYELIGRDPHFTPSLFASTYVPIIKGRFELNVADGIDVEITPFNLEKLNAEYTVETSGKVTKHVWTFENYEAYKYEGGGSYISRFVPHILVRVKSYNYGADTVFESIKDLHGWYCDFIDQSSEDDLSQIKTLVDSLTSGIDDDMEAAKTLYQWVQKNIEYVAIEDGYNGYQPEFASKVCSSRFGDCKGMSNLLQNMYTIYGLESHLTWLGTRDIAYTYDEVPSPFTDNHVVLTLVVDGESFILDPTHSLLSIYTPSPFIQGKQALVNKDCEGFELVYVPIMEAENNVLYDSVSVRIEEDNLIGEGYAVLSGYSRMYFTQGLVQSDYQYLKDYGRQYFSKGSNKFVLDTIWIENLDERDEPLRVNYHFRINDYVVANDNEKYVNLHLHLNFDSKVEDEDKILPLMIEFRTKVVSRVNLILGTEETVSDLPENHTFNDEQFSFDAQYNIEGNSVRLEFEEVYNYIEIPPSRFEEWNSFVSDLSKSRRESLIIYTNE